MYQKTFLPQHTSSLSTPTSQSHNFQSSQLLSQLRASKNQTTFSLQKEQKEKQDFYTQNKQRFEETRSSVGTNDSARRPFHDKKISNIVTQSLELSEKKLFKNSQSSQSARKQTSIKRQNSQSSTISSNSQKKGKRQASAKNQKQTLLHSQPKQARQASQTARKQPVIYNAQYNPAIPDYPICRGVPDSVPACDRTLLIGPQSEENRGKKTLVLDLDETLVHSSFQQIPNADIHLHVEIDGQSMPVFVQKRPFCEEFIKHMAPHFEIVMFTASLSKYARPLYDHIDTQDKTAYVLYREHCTFWNGIFVKDLTRLGRNMKDVIIVDNSPAAYLFQTENALPCQSWYSDKSDTELLQMVPLLQKLSQIDDVREKMKLFVKDARINFEKANKILQDEIIAQKTRKIKENLNPEILMTPPTYAKKQLEEEDKPAFRSSQGQKETPFSNNEKSTKKSLDFGQQKFSLLQPVLQQKDVFSSKKTSIESNSREAFQNYQQRQNNDLRQSQDQSKRTENSASKSFLKQDDSKKSQIPSSYVTPQAQSIVKKALQNNQLSQNLIYQTQEEKPASQVMTSLEGFKNQRIIYQQQAQAIDEMKRKALQSNRLLSSSQKENKPAKSLKPKTSTSQSSALTQMDSQQISHVENRKHISQNSSQKREIDSSLKMHYSLQDKKYQEYVRSLQKQQQQRSAQRSSNGSASRQKGFNSKGSVDSNEGSYSRISSQKKQARAQSAKNMKYQNTSSPTSSKAKFNQPPRLDMQQPVSVAPSIPNTGRNPQGTPKNAGFILKQTQSEKKLQPALQDAQTFLGIKQEERQQNFNVFLKDLQVKRQSSKALLETVNMYEPKENRLLKESGTAQFGYNPQSLMAQSQKFSTSKEPSKKFLTKVSTNQFTATKGMLYRNTQTYRQ